MCGYVPIVWGGMEVPAKTSALHLNSLEGTRQDLGKGAWRHWLAGVPPIQRKNMEPDVRACNGDHSGTGRVRGGSCAIPAVEMEPCV